jgi:hypothetical protein
LTVDLVLDDFDLELVSTDVGVSDRRLFCSSNDFSDDERSTPN